MALSSFQLLCLPIIGIAYAALFAQSNRRAALALEVLILATAGALSEHSAIALYGFYEYAEGWWLPLGHVPLLVAMIWPLVLLSAREVACTLWPQRTATLRTAIIVAIVLFDASLMEIVAVDAGYWRWFESGYMGVPLMGMTGWGCFALAVAMVGKRLDGRAWQFPVAIIAIAAITHLLLLAIWWGALRWFLRDALPPSSLLVYGIFSAWYAMNVWRTPSERRLPTLTAMPRLVAATAFFILLAQSTSPESPWIWGHVALAAMPYLLATRWPSPMSSVRD